MLVGKFESWGAVMGDIERVNVTIPAGLHRRVKRLCEREHIPFSALVSLLLRVYLDCCRGNFGKRLGHFMAICEEKEKP
jgi:hypothetical protein